MGGDDCVLKRMDPRRGVLGLLEAVLRRGVLEFEGGELKGSGGLLLGCSSLTLVSGLER